MNLYNRSVSREGEQRGRAGRESREGEQRERAGREGREGEQNRLPCHEVTEENCKEYGC